MKVQVIGYSEKKQDGNVYYSTFESPKSLDEFDINVLDISDERVWQNKDANYSGINSFKDLLSVKKMIEYRKKSIVVYALPQNNDFCYHLFNGEYNYKIKMKDAMETIEDRLLDHIKPTVWAIPQLIYENTITTLGGTRYEAAFFFDSTYNVLTQSDKSDKATTILLDHKLYFTTLNITQTSDGLNNYLNYLDQFFNDKEKEKAPEWMKDVCFNDDVEQMRIIKENEEIIKRSQERIAEANAQLEENNTYKSILYTNGNELVEVVFKILEQMLGCDLSSFIDEKKEDFLIHKESYTLIGEIKGINTNVKNDNISQLEVHYQQYIDRLQEEGKEENISQTLIINPLRSKPLSEREPVHENQINLAKRNHSIIIETKTLLRLYEAYKQGKVSTEECEKLFTTKTGLLEERDFY